LDSDYKKIKDDILTIISLIQTDNIYYTPSVIKEKAERIREKFTHNTSDHLTLLNVFNQWKENKQQPNWAKDHFLNDKALRKAEDIKKQLKSYLDKISLDRGDNVKEEEVELILSKIENNNQTDKTEQEDLIMKCLLTGFFTNLARYSGDNYFTTLKDKVLCKVHPTSILIKNPKLGKQYEYLIFNDLIVTNKQYLKCCSLVRQDLIKKYI
jgi:HrpA-like RNA helicase